MTVETKTWGFDIPVVLHSRYSREVNLRDRSRLHTNALEIYLRNTDKYNIKVIYSFQVNSVCSFECIWREFLEEEEQNHV